MTAAVRHHAQELVEQGYTLIDGIRTDEEAAEALGRFGPVMPQYDGRLRYQVKAVPGYENRRYSKSTNTILVHTEAPGWDPPPRHLALHCRVQATCGSGHTGLADGRAFLATLDDETRRVLYERQVDWLGHNISGVGTAGLRRPSVERTADGREVIRFSYNLFTAGDYDPPLDAAPDPESLPLGRLGLELAERAMEFFRDHRVSVLIPEDAVLIWDNQRMMHARSEYRDTRRHLTRYWLGEHG
ncbi:TauD/TfdA family dioxygenase [Streptomyces sp. NPDC050738]|uniref:TauD/TfdA family dioxygenase n=1 Tax=Streptomyces sp. NPDC050738 TaxID=3154744 RepID=UPI0034350A0B